MLQPALMRDDSLLQHTLHLQALLATLLADHVRLLTCGCRSRPVLSVVRLLLLVHALVVSLLQLCLLLMLC